MPPAIAPSNADYDQLSTPLVLADDEGGIETVNVAFARWLGISAKRLPGMPLAALELGGDALARCIREGGARDMVRLRRLAMAFPSGEPQFADIWLSRR
ncbi:MAG: PAS domain-containing sensor histidine kinase, partial [Luteimonas sp.]